ncbi:unnamed protein product [Gongylonema pulchrum]|uniref:ShKT domain-containing protein n=1 Tax=Gongylonema pulchrum TaxID=637853 RepID=A0A183E7T1_9BILA|nr:unnamed protein product [Gongylonema pulchrum]
MLGSVLLFLLIVLSVDASVVTTDNDASVIARCVQKIGNVSRPSVNPKACRASSSAVYCETLFGLGNKTQAENMDTTQNYKVSKLCYDPTLSSLSSRCRSYCNLCCEDPRFDCANSQFVQFLPFNFYFDQLSSQTTLPGTISRAGNLYKVDKWENIRLIG